MIAAMAAAQTDCVAAIPDRVADLCIQLLPLKRVAAPFPMPRLTTVMMWHERTDADPGATFFRQLVADAVPGRVDSAIRGRASASTGGVRSRRT